MELITDLFTKTPSIIEVYYIILGVSFIGFILFGLFPEQIALKLFIPYRQVVVQSHKHKKKKKEYNWSQALKRQSILLLVIFIYSIAVLLLTNLYGVNIAKIGLGILALIIILGGIWVDPVIRRKTTK